MTIITQEKDSLHRSDVTVPAIGKIRSMDLLAKTKKKILAIEAIRGFAAIYVMFGHVIQLYQPYSFFPEYRFAVKTLFGYGNEAVILFFIVSGFSIHYSSSSIAFSQKESIKKYVFKRFRRIYPLYLLSLIISLVVLWITHMPFGINSIILSFALLTDVSDGAFASPISTNFPIWSLSYEAVYYLLYPVLLIVFRKTGIRNMIIYSVIISLVAGGISLSVYRNHFSNIIQLYWVWVAGAVIADFKMNGENFKFSYLKGLVMLCFAFMVTVEKWHLFRDWSCALFFSLLMFSFFVQEETNNISQKVGNVAIGLFAAAVCYCLTFSPSVVIHFHLLRYILILISVFSILIVFIPIELFRRCMRMILKPFTKAGTISYAIYIFHWPLIILTTYIFKDVMNKNLPLMLLVIGMNLMTVFLMSWYAELKLQPRIVDYLNGWFAR